MKITVDMANIITQIANDFDDYEYVGVRIQEEPFSPGEIDHRSSVWVDGDETDEVLDGICAIDVNSVHRIANNPWFYGYPGDHCAIIAGNSATGGEDDGEIIIHDPIVVHIVS